MSKTENMAINIIIDEGDANNAVFVEIENDDGKSICIGERIPSEDGLTKIRITRGDILEHLQI